MDFLVFVLPKVRSGIGEMTMMLQRIVAYLSVVQKDLSRPEFNAKRLVYVCAHSGED